MTSSLSEHPAQRSWPAAGYLIYAGLVVGVTFIATPAKFLAPHLSIPVALEVGRHTFHVFNRIEWIILLCLLLCGLVRRPQGRWWFILGGASAVVAVQGAWLLPILDARVQLIIEGGSPAPSSLHRVYVGLEALKVLTLLTSLKRPSGRPAAAQRGPPAEISLGEHQGRSERLADRPGTFSERPKFGEP